MAFPDAWEEECLVSIAAKGGSDIEFAATTETVDIDAGEKGGEGLPNLKGGRIWKVSPETDTTITFEGYPVDINTSGGTGVSQMFHTTRTNWDVGQPLIVSNSRNRDLFRVAILWTNDTTATSGAGAVASGSEGYRYVITEARMISCKPSFTDGILKFTFAFKVPAFQKDGTSNITEQSCDNTAALTALGSYT